MKIKLAFFLSFMAVCLLLFMTGCSSPQKDIQTDSTSAVTQSDIPTKQNNIEIKKPYMPNPKIVLGVRRNGLDTMQYEVTGNSAVIGGPLEYINIIFEKSVEGNNFSKLITMDGYENLHIDKKSVFETVHINMGMACGINTTLTISKDIIDTSGRRLRDDIKVNINILEMGAKAHYIVEGMDGTYDMEEYMIQFKILSTQDKDFIIDFSKAVDRKSVEASIGKALSEQEVTYQFEWIDDKDLRLGMHGLKPSKRDDGTYKDYVINVEDAVDCDGNQVCWNFEFFANEPNNLGYIDLGTRKTAFVHEFNDIPYMVYNNYYMDKYALIYNFPAEKLFNIDENKIIGDFFNNKEWHGIWNMDWIDEKTLFTYDLQNNQIYKYTLDNDGISETIPLPFISQDQSLIMMKISPDRQKVALIFSKWEQPVDLYIISVDGKLLHKYESIVRPNIPKSYTPEQHMAWMDNENIVFDDARYDGKSYCDIVKINTENGKKETLIKDATSPEVLPGSNIVLAHRYGVVDINSDEYVIVSGGKEVGAIKENPDNSSQMIFCLNFLFADSDHLVFNRNDDLVLYTISPDKEEVLCKGTIVGSSQDRNRIYFMTNYVSFYSSN